MDLAGWLRSLGLERYEAAFRENEITEKVLPNLTAEDLKELGVNALGHRRMLLDAIAALRADAVRKDHRLRLVHRRLRHARSEGGEGVTGRASRVKVQVGFLRVG